MMALLLLVLMITCLNLQPKAAAKAAPKALPKAALHLGFPLMGGFPQDVMNIFDGMNRQLSTNYHPGAHQLPSGGGGGGGGGGGVFLEDAEEDYAEVQ